MKKNVLNFYEFFVPLSLLNSQIFAIHEFIISVVQSQVEFEFFDYVFFFYYYNIDNGNKWQAYINGN